MRGTIVLTVASLFAVAAASAAHRSDRSSPIAERGSVARLAPDATAAIMERFGVLRRAPVEMHPVVDPVYARSVGLNLEEARPVVDGVFAVLGAGSVCTVRESGAAACTPNAAVGKDFLVEGACRRVSVSGLVPDEIVSAVVRTRDGSVRSVGVSDNFLDVKVSVRSAGDVPTAVEYGDAVYPVPAAEPC